MRGQVIVVGAVVAALVSPAWAAAQDGSSEHSPAVLIGAGDIASCHSRGDERTARILDRRAGTIFTTGDNAYPAGTALDYRECFDPSWGRHRERIRPAPGNHDYRDGGAPYHDYFGAAAGPEGKGYYSYDLGDWHVVVLNSTLEDDAYVAQLAWLEEDLNAHPSRCALAYWHHPLFSSGAHSRHDDVREFWRRLYAHGVDVVLNGHDHMYERFAPQSPDGRADAAGIRQFTVGTGGGGEEHDVERVQPNSEIRSDHVEGLLELELLDDGYRWQFLPAEGSTFEDSGAATCTPIPVRAGR